MTIKRHEPVAFSPSPERPVLSRAQLNAGTSMAKRSFVEEVKRCDELFRMLRSIREELEVCLTHPCAAGFGHAVLPAHCFVVRALQRVPPRLSSVGPDCDFSCCNA